MYTFGKCNDILVESSGVLKKGGGNTIFLNLKSQFAHKTSGRIQRVFFCLN